MSLEKQLSLTQNGGVYYEGTRVTPTIDPVLFIGLGGTGIDAMLRIKNEVQTRMPLPKGSNGQVLATSPNNISFLAVDTDLETLKKTYGVAGFSKSGDEFINLSVDGLPQVINSVVEKNLDKPEWSWYDRDLTANGGLDGANGIRQIGRFMLFQKITDVNSKLTRTIEKVVRAAEKSNSLKVFILSGIGGGTGSGTFLDMAYIVRALANEKTPNVQIHGYIFTPDLNIGNGGDEKSLYRNGFASLKELDYWMSANEHGQSFVQRYSTNFAVNSKDRPFDYCHIITAQDADHNQVTYEEAMNAVGSNLFAYIVSEEVSLDGNTALKEMYDNISGHIVIANKPYPANYNYLSVGSSKLEIPYTEITTLMAARVFERMEPIFAKEPTLETFNQDMFNLELTQKHLWGYIHKDIIPNPLQGKKFTYGDVWPGNQPYGMANKWLNEHAQNALHNNRVNILKYYDERFCQYFLRLMKSNDRGPCYTAKLIQSAGADFSMIKALEALRDDCRGKIAACASKGPGLKSKMEQSFFQGKTCGLLQRGTALKQYIEDLNAWLGNEYGYRGYSELADGLDDLINRLKKYYTRIFANLLDILTSLPVIFKANTNKLIVDEQEAQKNLAVASRYLIRPLEFEKKFMQTLGKQTETAAASFNEYLCDNLKRWIGLNLEEIDADILDNTDVCGSIAEFVNNCYGETLTMNMERLLMDKAPAGMESEEYIREVLDDLCRKAVPMYHMDVTYAGLDVKAFSLESIPNDCPRIYGVANREDRPREDRPKFSAERSKLQWVKVMAGMPLYAFPAVSKMERMYEQAMKTSRETRRGVHLRWEWREELPSPLPEGTWPDAFVNESEKDFSRNYNARIREAFNKCVEAGVIQVAPNGDHAILYRADNSKMNNLALFGTIQQKKEMIETLRSNLWNDASTALQLNPYGSITNGDLLDRVRENTLRFYETCKEIIAQAEILDQFQGLTGQYENVEKFADALFADLIFEQGFDIKFRRSELDISPIALYDKMSQNPYSEYECYKAFSKALTRESKEDIANQVDRAKRKLIGLDGNLIEEVRNQKVTALENVLSKLKAEYADISDRAERTPIEQRGAMMDALDFYEKAIELVTGKINSIK